MRKHEQHVQRVRCKTKRKAQGARRKAQGARRKAQGARRKAQCASHAPDCRLGGAKTDMRVVGKRWLAKTQRTKRNSGEAQGARREAQSARRKARGASRKPQAASRAHDCKLGGAVYSGDTYEHCWGGVGCKNVPHKAQLEGRGARGKLQAAGRKPQAAGRASDCKQSRGGRGSARRTAQGAGRNAQPAWFTPLAAAMQQSTAGEHCSISLDAPNAVTTVNAAASKAAAA